MHYLPIDVTWGLYAHIIIETPALLGFLLKPSNTLLERQPHAEPVIRQYGALLLSMNILLAVLIWEVQENHAALNALVRRVSLAVLVYHILPLHRATQRVANQERAKNLLAEPVLHALLHGICATILASAALGLLG